MATRNLKSCDVLSKPFFHPTFLSFSHPNLRGKNNNKLNKTFHFLLPYRGVDKYSCSWMTCWLTITKNEYTSDSFGDFLDRYSTLTLWLFHFLTRMDAVIASLIYVFLFQVWFQENNSICCLDMLTSPSFSATYLQEKFHYRYVLLFPLFFRFSRLLASLTACTSIIDKNRTIKILTLWP